MYISLNILFLLGIEKYLISKYSAFIYLLFVTRMFANKTNMLKSVFFYSLELVKRSLASISNNVHSNNNLFTNRILYKINRKVFAFIPLLCLVKIKLVAFLSLLIKFLAYLLTKLMKEVVDPSRLNFHQ